MNDFNSLQWLLNKYRKRVITPRNAGDPEIIVPPGHKYDEFSNEIVPLSEHEIKVDKLKDELTDIIQQTKEMEKEK